MESVTELFGFYRKRYIAVNKNRKDIPHFARNVQIKGNVYIVIILLEHSSQFMIASYLDFK
jgi:hypothetical protein